MIHTLRASMTSGMLFGGDFGAGAATIRSPSEERRLNACICGLQEGSWGRLRWETRDVLAGGGAPPYDVAKVGGQYAIPDPGQPPAGAHPHRGGHAINGMHPPRPGLSARTNSP